MINKDGNCKQGQELESSVAVDVAAVSQQAGLETQENIFHYNKFKIGKFRGKPQIADLRCTNNSDKIYPYKRNKNIDLHVHYSHRTLYFERFCAFSDLLSKYMLVFYLT